MTCDINAEKEQSEKNSLSEEKKKLKRASRYSVVATPVAGHESQPRLISLPRGGDCPCSCDIVGMQVDRSEAQEASCSANGVKVMR